MCVAVVVPAGKRLSDEMILAMSKANDDSWGFGFLGSYANGFKSTEGYDKYIVPNKGITGGQAAVDAYNRALETPGRNDFPHLAHFRITTAGLTNLGNAHPFILKHGGMVHNGHFPGNTKSDHSDTAQFAQAIKDVVRPGMTTEQVAWLSKQVGSNKVAFLWRDGTTTILNEHLGTVLPDGIWVSNTFWKHHLK